MSQNESSTAKSGDRSHASIPDTGRSDPPAGNDDFPWDSFDSHDYLNHNYARLRDDDREIIDRMADFFARVDNPDQISRGIDVGSGTNLYPALAMLPLCHEITLWETALTNHQWLTNEVRNYSSNWDEFWNRLRLYQPYQRIADARMVLSDRAKVDRRSIFELPPRTWEIGTMFFVAESITRMPREFVVATHRFVRALKPRAPFAAAFMKNSRGYQVGRCRFPAVAINERDVEQCLEAVAQDVKIHTIRKIDTPLRDGYDGMILATGRAKR